jgi:hypothetical protein
VISSTINPQWCALHLPSRHIALFDAADRVLVEQYAHWHAIPARDTFYVQAGEDTTVLLHRLITSAPKGLLVDHVNRDGLDNRRANLRLCNESQNKANRPAPRSNTSGYKGVSKTPSGRWSAYITVDYRRRALGTFDTAAEAAQAYNAAAIEAWGEFAFLNTVSGSPVGPAGAIPAPPQ